MLPMVAYELGVQSCPVHPVRTAPFLASFLRVCRLPVPNFMIRVVSVGSTPQQLCEAPLVVL